jgi:hypothetical protein
MTDYLTASVLHLHALFPVFDHFYLADEEAVPRTSEDDETIDLAQLVCPILDFVSETVRHGKSKAWLESNLQQLVSAVFNYVQITHDDVRDGFRNDTSLLIVGYRKKLGPLMQMLLSHKRTMKARRTVCA